MKLIRSTILVYSLYFTTAHADYEYQWCNEKGPISTPTERFELDSGGLANDSLTGLQWMRCLAGQSWTGTTCDGEALDLGWSDALEYSKNFVHAGESDWRIPNIKELSSIVELSCKEPALNPVVFPNSWFPGVNERHWTSTPIVDTDDLLWTVLFSIGDDFPASYSAFEEHGTHFRLVRDTDK